MKINRHNTAIKRSKLSAPTKWAWKHNQIRSKIYDWGCGRGDDAEFLKNDGFSVIAYDPYHCPENSPEMVDFGQIQTVMNNYVLNVIEHKATRTILLKKIADKISDKTKVILSVRGRNEIENNAEKKGWKAYKDGFITSSNTFQKGYYQFEIEALCQRFFDVYMSETLSGGTVLVLTKKVL